MESKPLYKSLTVIAGLVFVILGYLESVQVLPAGTLTMAQGVQSDAVDAVGKAGDLAQTLAAFASLVGLRRAIG